MNVRLDALKRAGKYVLAYLAFAVVTHILLAITTGAYYPIQRSGTLTLELLFALAVLAFATIHPIIAIAVMHILLFFAGIPHTEMIVNTLGINIMLGILVAQIVMLPTLADYIIAGSLAIVLGYMIGRETIPNVQEMFEAIFARFKRW